MIDDGTFGFTRLSSESGTEFSKRLKAVLEHRFAGVQSKLISAANLPAGSVSQYLAGTRMPGAEAVAAICKASGANANWLLLGEGPMFRPTAADSDRAEVAADNLTLYRETVAAQRETIALLRRELEVAHREAERLRKLAFPEDVRDAVILNEPGRKG